MKLINWLIITAFFFTSIIGAGPEIHAQTGFNLPLPGSMISLSKPYDPLELRGIQVYPKNPLHFDFLVDKGESGLTGQALNDEVTRLTKYFLTCLTVPETDLWVNLSPYEKNRIEPDNFGITQMGKDLLEQDYLLKQITASLTYPESDLGRRFWKKLYEKAYALYKTTDIPVNTFNKVWIVPESADVYVHGTNAFVAHSELNVMLDIDYLALKKNLNDQEVDQYSQIYRQVMREMILPVLRKEVNSGKNFAVVRQVFQAMILATWYKRHLKNSFLGKVYVGKNKVTGVDVSDKDVKEKIFQQYLRAFKKKVYSYIKEDYSPLTQKTVSREYVSGGLNFGKLGNYSEKAQSREVLFNNNLAMASIYVSPFSMQNSAMASRIGKIVKKSLLPLVLLAAAAGMTAPPLKAAEITHNPDGKTVHVLVTKKDSKLGLGGILLQKEAGYTKLKWGKNGTAYEVARMAKINPGHLEVGQEFDMPTAQEFELRKTQAAAPILETASTGGIITTPAPAVPMAVEAGGRLWQTRCSQHRQSQK